MQKKSSSDLSLAIRSSKGLSLVWKANRIIFNKKAKQHKLTARTSASGNRRKARSFAPFGLPFGLVWRKLTLADSQSLPHQTKTNKIVEAREIKLQKQGAKILPNKAGLFSVDLINAPSWAIDPRQSLKYKVLQTSFRRTISDQKKRAVFAKSELVSKLLKTVLTVDYRFASFWAPRSPDPEGTHSIGRLVGATVGPALSIQPYIKRRFNTPTAGSSRLRNRCILTDKPSVIAHFRLSRISLRRLAGEGHIPGLVKNKA